MSELQARVQALFRPELGALNAYHVQDSHGLVKLDAMENPYSWPDAMIEDWLSLLRDAAINRYPDPSASALCSVLRQSADIPEEMGVLLGNGSDELIQIILMAVAGRKRAVLAPEPTFVMYRQLAVAMGLEFVGVPLHPGDFSLDMAAMRAGIEQHDPAVIFLAYPNNPTGNLFAAEDIERILALSEGLVVVDEAYLPFAGATFLSRLRDHDNLLVLRTLSKMGLAGLRLGYLVGAEPWINELDKLRLPYNINILTQISAKFALEKAGVFSVQVEHILAERESLHRALNRLPGIRAYPSHANFILFAVDGETPQHVFELLKQRGILIKHFPNALAPLGECLRVTVGTPEENRLFLEALASVPGMGGST